jgi:hypothetical protein
MIDQLVGPPEGEPNPSEVADCLRLWSHLMSDVSYDPGSRVSLELDAKSGGAED